MSAFGVAEDPAALRATAAALRRDAELLSSTTANITGHVGQMGYAGPAADLFRAGIALNAIEGINVSARLVDLAVWLDQCAFRAEQEIAARRVAGLA